MTTFQNKQANNAETKPTEEADHARDPLSPAAAVKSQPKPAHSHYEITCKTEKDWWDKAKPFVEIAGVALLTVYTFYTIKMYCANQQAADAAKSAADTAANSLILGERPWVKIKHKIVQPLAFDTPGANGTVASLIVEDTLENVGPSVALNVFTWEDVIPLDPNFGTTTARARQDEWCNANRSRDKQNGLTGSMLFPHDPFIEQSHIGPPTDKVTKAADATPGNLHGKAGFVMVGCVVYRSSFESKDVPAHETKFMYWIGKDERNGAVNVYVVPKGVHPELQLVAFPDGFSAD